MKTATITFHSSHNCGSILQSYALQNVIRNKYKFDNEILDFSNDGSRNMYSFYYQNNSFSNLIKNVLLLFHFKICNRNYFKYDEYIKKHLHLSNEKYNSIDDLKFVENYYDCFICGSDQIWNVTCKDADDAYFLPFVKNKRKIAYAPSMGAKDITKYSNDPHKYSEYIKDINYVSVREFNGQKFINELTSMNVPVLADPTLLLDSKDYDSISEPSGIKGKYIFYYSYGYNDNENRVVHNISKKLNIPVIVFNGKRWVTIGLKYSNFHIPKNENPGVFLDLVKNASYVITTSFHGTVFSAIYKKNFWVINNAGMKDDDRVASLLKQLGIQNRYINFDDNLSEFDFNQSIDYDSVEQNVDKMRKQAFTFLDKAFGCDHNE